MIKGIIFDFGGTLDTGGDHWFNVFYDCSRDLGYSFYSEDFRKAYVFAERNFKPSEKIKTFGDVLGYKLALQAHFLTENGFLDPQEKDVYVFRMCNYALAIVSKHINSVRPMLDRLYIHYRLAVVSNFYGCLKEVLRQFDLLKYFETVIDSAVVGIRKPDPRIFEQAIGKLRLSPETIAVVGDSLDKDIIPAASLGCKVVWLKKRGWNDADAHTTEVPAGTVIINRLNELPEKL